MATAHFLVLMSAKIRLVMSMSSAWQACRTWAALLKFSLGGIPSESRRERKSRLEPGPEFSNPCSKF